MHALLHDKSTVCDESYSQAYKERGFCRVCLKSCVSTVPALMIAAWLHGEA